MIRGVLKIHLQRSVFDTNSVERMAKSTFSRELGYQDRVYSSKGASNDNSCQLSQSYSVTLSPNPMSKDYSTKDTSETIKSRSSSPSDIGDLQSCASADCSKPPIFDSDPPIIQVRSNSDGADSPTSEYCSGDSSLNQNDESDSTIVVTHLQSALKSSSSTSLSVSPDQKVVRFKPGLEVVTYVKNENTSSETSSIDFTVLTDEEISAMYCSDMTIHDIDDFLLLRIFSLLGCDDLVCCSQVCRQWEYIVWTGVDLWDCVTITDNKKDANPVLYTVFNRLGRNVTMIKHLDLFGCDSLTDDLLFEIVTTLSELLTLDLSYCQSLTNSGVTAILLAASSLNTLSMQGCNNLTFDIPSTALGRVSAHSLRTLDLSDCAKISDLSVQIICYLLPKLKKLYLRHCRTVTDQSVHCIALTLHSLRDLSLCRCDITDFALCELSRLSTSLKYLSLAACNRVTDKGICYLSRFCNRLRYLNLHRHGYGITGKSFKAIASNLKELRSLDISFSPTLTDTDFLFLSQLHSLSRINLKSCSNITDGGLVKFATDRPARPAALHHIDVTDCCHITPKVCQRIRQSCASCVVLHDHIASY